ncbi:MAG: hypothetical protein ACHQ1G_10305 [Planctomycetota bacterium]
MKNPLLVGVAWAATVALAFLLGGKLRSEASARGDPRPATGHDTAAPEAPSPRAPEARGDEPARPAAMAPAATPEAQKPLVVVPGMKPGDFSASFMEYAGKQLARGPEGQKELFREVDRLMKDQGLKELFRDEQAVMPLIYPWVKFLVQHDREVIAMMETIYQTAAEEPAWFEGLDDDTFEALAEGLAVILPGAVNEEQLARFRAHVEKILALPKESLPEALQKNMNDLARNLEWWSPPLTVQQVIAILNDPNTSATKKLALIRRADPEALRGIDVTRIVADAVRAGDGMALWTLQDLPKGSIDTTVLDAAVLDMAGSDELAWHAISSYLDITGRGTWEAARPFIQTGLARGGKTTEAFAQSLVYMANTVPKDFVQGMLATYPLADGIKKQLRAEFGIE